MRRHLPFLAALALASCAYYNGLYNAKDLARRAEHSERLGRQFEARSLWAQSAVKAETVLVHHPHSRWTEEARWLNGKALERSGNCRAALAPLQRTLQEARDPKRADDAALRLSACEAILGDLDAAGFAATRLLDHPDPKIRAEARWRTGTTYRRSGRTDEAIALLRRSGHPRARGELAAALADSGAPGPAIALADSLLAERDSLAPWGVIISSIAARDRAGGSALLDRVITRIAPVRDSALAWMIADAERWIPGDTARAYERLRRTYARGPRSAAGFEALLVLLRARLAVSEDPRILDTIAVELSEVPPTAGNATFEGQDLAVNAALARARLDSIAPAIPQGDLRGFLLAESLRDSLGAPRLAALVWRRVISDRPDSPYAPKALLALAAVGAAPTDSVLAVLDASYPGSPYLHVYRGAADPGFHALEDSLFRFGLVQSGPAPYYRAPAAGTPASSDTTADGKVIQ